MQQKTISRREYDRLRNKFIAEHSKIGTPNDCTKLNADAQDCLERNANYDEQCESCREYDRVVTEFERQYTYD